MCVHKAWNLKYDTTEITTLKVAHDDYLKITIWWGRNETFDSDRFKSIKENFSDGGNE